jgi:4-hydroxy-tetrahydrodipicolinate synthase
VIEFSGSFVALITPFKADRVDRAGLEKNIDFQLQNGTSGLVPCGSTGETPTLSHEEWETVIATTVARVNKKIPVFPGTGTNDTRKTIDLTRRAEELGADAALVVSPYYNKPTQEGLYRHFRAVAESVEIPIMVYNIPGRTGVNILPETFERLCRDCQNIKAVKEAAGSIDQASEIILRCGERLTVLSGDDSLTLPMMAVGAKGVVTVIGNIVPGDVARLCDHMLNGRMKDALVLHQQLLPLCKAMFVESNPIPVKTAMHMLGLPAGELRLPLCEPSEKNKEVIESALRKYGLL